MKHISLAFLAGGLLVLSGCGGPQSADTGRYAQTYFADLDYVGDSVVGHRLDIRLPANEGRHPVVVVICGSAWFANDNKQAGFESVGRPLLERGFAVAAINHRGSPEAGFPAQINDVKAAIRFLRGNAERYHLDAGFVGITGFSSGGHLAAFAAASNGIKEASEEGVTIDVEGSLGSYLEQSSAVQASVDWFGPIDMERMTDVCQGCKGADSPEAVMLRGAPADNLPLTRLFSPMHYLTYNAANCPKILVIHGDADPVVPYCQSVMWADSLSAHDRLEEFVTWPGGGHGPLTFNDTTFQKMTDYFAREAKLPAQAQKPAPNNPIIDADVPDMSMLRVGDTYYMSSTTMHCVPNIPIMASQDLVNWRIVGYATDTLSSQDELTLSNGKSAYGHGTWASCLRHHNGRFYLSSFAKTTDKTYIFTADSASGPWTRQEFAPACHDHSIFWDGDTPYMVSGNGRLYIAQLKPDLSGFVENTRRVLIDNASLPAGGEVGLGAEGSQMFRVNGMWYLVNITWPKGGVRTVVVHRSSSLDGPWEGKAVFRDRGIAQGGLVDTPDGRWFAYLFEDNGASGRRPYIVPVEWSDGWPQIGVGGVAPAHVDGLPDNRGVMPGIVASDEFNEEELPLQWQWNHNPDNRHWSLSSRGGWLTVGSANVATDLLSARNTLTQRTFGPTSQCETLLDGADMVEGDYAGLCLLQKRYGQIGLLVEGGKRYIVARLMVGAQGDSLVELREPIAGPVARFKAVCDFRQRRDRAQLYYAEPQGEWRQLGPTLQMAYTIPHFMGYRFGLYMYNTKRPGGLARFDYAKFGY